VHDFGEAPTRGSAHTTTTWRGRRRWSGDPVAMRSSVRGPVDHGTCVGQQELVGGASERCDVRVGGLIGGRRHSGEERRCGGWRGFQGGPARADGDEGGSATTKRRREALGEVAHQEDRFDGGTVMAQPSSVDRR
jgi:hypothetical protein